jgi:hypothetical protein
MPVIAVNKTSDTRAGRNWERMDMIIPHLCVSDHWPIETRALDWGRAP